MPAREKTAQRPVASGRRMLRSVHEPMHVRRWARGWRAVNAPLRLIPNFAELLDDPIRAAELPADAARLLLVRVAALQAALSAALMPPSSAATASASHGDRLLGVADVAVKVGKSRSWVEKHVDELPPRRRVGGEGLWSERELEAWIRTRPRWDDG